MANINDDEGMMIDEVQEIDMNESLRIIEGILTASCEDLRRIKENWRGTVNANIEDYVSVLVGNRYEQRDIDNIYKIIFDKYVKLENCGDQINIKELESTIQANIPSRGGKRKMRKTHKKAKRSHKKTRKTHKKVRKSRKSHKKY